MPRHGKRYRKGAEAIEAEKAYELAEAIALLQEAPTAKFDESVEIAINLGVDPKHADQMVRGALVLPHGTGKGVRVLVFAKGDKEKEATEAGADYVGAGIGAALWVAFMLAMEPARAAVMTAAANLAIGLVFLAQRALVYPGQWMDATSWLDEPPGGVDRLWVETDGDSVEAWIIPAEGPEERAAIIYAHGNGELIDSWLVEMREVATLGFTVMLVEFPGYGRSAGRPNRTRVGEVFTAAYDSLRTRVRAFAGRLP